jgi:tetratricopeptide (TPR) repeat protein
VTHAYGVRDVEKLLRLPRSTLRALIDAGFVVPARGPRGAWRFSFRDLIVLRTAQALVDANVPARRITRSIRELRRHLPAAMPLSGLRIGVVGDHVVVKERDGHWQAETGQYLLAFGGDPADGSLSVIEHASDPGADAKALDAANAQEWFARGAELERTDVDAALRAYARAIAADPAFVDAYINLGRLLHVAKRVADAERVYRQAIEHCGDDPVLLFNLGVLLDDAGRAPEAMAVYEAAVRGDPGFADGHYNLALVCEQLALPKKALRHMARYRALVGAASK